jgi:hypothetical protein
MTPKSGTLFSLFAFPPKFPGRAEPMPEVNAPLNRTHEFSCNNETSTD